MQLREALVCRKAVAAGIQNTGLVQDLCCTYTGLAVLKVCCGCSGVVVLQRLVRDPLKQLRQRLVERLVERLVQNQLELLRQRRSARA